MAVPAPPPSRRQVLAGLGVVAVTLAGVGWARSRTAPPSRPHDRPAVGSPGRRDGEPARRPYSIIGVL